MDKKTKLYKATTCTVLCVSLAISVFTAKHVSMQEAHTKELYAAEPVISVSRNDIEEQKEAVKETGKTASMRIEYHDGFVLKDSDIWLKRNGKTIAFRMNGEHQALFSSESDVARVGSINVMLTDAGRTEDIVCILENNGTRQAAARIKLTNDCGGIATTNVKGEDDAAAKAAVSSVLKDAIEVSRKSLSFFGHQIQETWLEKVIVTEESVSLSNGDETIYVSHMQEPIEGTGFDGRLDIEGVEIFTSDLVDVETGYRPFLFIAGEDKFEILAKSDDAIKTFFSGCTPEAPTANN